MQQPGRQSCFLTRFRAPQRQWFNMANLSTPSQSSSTPSLRTLCLIIRRPTPPHTHQGVLAQGRCPLWMPRRIDRRHNSATLRLCLAILVPRANRTRHRATGTIPNHSDPRPASLAVVGNDTALCNRRGL